MGTAPGTLEVPLPPSLASRLGNGRGIDVTANSVLGTRDLEGGGLEALTVRETNWQRGHNALALYLQGQLAGRRHGGLAICPWTSPIPAKRTNSSIRLPSSASRPSLADDNEAESSKWMAPSPIQSSHKKEKSYTVQTRYCIEPPAGPIELLTRDAISSICHRSDAREC